MNRRNGIYTASGDFISFAESNKKSLYQMLASRDKSASFYSTILGYLPDPDEILRKTGNDITVYKSLLTDPHVYSVTEQRKNQVREMEFEINRGKSKSRNARYIEDLFNDPDFDVWGLIDNMLKAPDFGMQPFEIMWKKGMRIMPERIVDRPVEWFVFDNDNNPRFRSKTNRIDGEELFPRKFLFARNKPTYENPYGERILSRCFWPVTFKKASDKWWVQLLEKYGMVFAIGKLPRNQMQEGSTEVTKLLDLMENLISDAVSVIPDDSSVDFKDAPNKGTSADMYKVRMEFSNSEISKAIITQTLTTEVQGKGTQALGTVHQDSLKAIGSSDKKICEKEFNKLIKFIYELNFNDTDYPTMEIFEPEDVDAALAERDGVLTDKLGVKFNEDYISEEYNIDKKYFSIGQPVSAADPLKAGLPAAVPAKADTTAALNVPLDQNFQEKIPVWKKFISYLFGESVPEKTPGQQLTEQLTGNIPIDILQKQMETTLKPVLTLLNNGEDYETVMAQLAEIYPDMKTSEQENLLTKMIFLSETIGRLEETES